MTTQIILVPGFWLGAWAWDEVADDLRRRGFGVTALTLPGLDPSADRSNVTLETHVAAIEAVPDPTASRRVLVCHSGAAVPTTVVLDRHPELIDHVVFVDTAPVADGFTMNADLDGDLALDDAWDDEMEQGSMRDLTDDQLATFRQRAVPQPGGVVRDVARMNNPARFDVPATVICTTFPSEQFRSYAEQGVPFLAGLLEFTNVNYVDLPTGHWPMWSKPVELAQAIAAAAEPNS